MKSFQKKKQKQTLTNSEGESIKWNECFVLKKLKKKEKLSESEPLKPRRKKRRKFPRKEIEVEVEVEVNLNQIMKEDQFWKVILRSKSSLKSSELGLAVLKDDYR